jgi:hypothetical protein
MRSDQLLRKEFLLLQRQLNNKIDKIMNSLRRIDPNSNTLTLGDAIASRQMIKKLWDFLPEEADAFSYESIDRLTSDGRDLLPANIDSSVILHVGWDVLSFKTTLRAAWEGYPTFCELDIETFNICIYPDSFKWYVICAGHHFYPMDCRGGQRPIIATAGIRVG